LIANAEFSWANLHEKYWSWSRMAEDATVNAGAVTMDSAIRFLEQGSIRFFYATALDPFTMITATLTGGAPIEIKRDLETDYVELILGFDPYKIGTSAYGPVMNVSDCVNSDYTSFSGASPTGFTAESNGSSVHNAGTADEIVVSIGTELLVTFTCTLNGGVLGLLKFVDSLGFDYESNIENVTEGVNSHTLTSAMAGTGQVEFSHSSTATNFTISNLSVREIL